MENFVKSSDNFQFLVYSNSAPLACSLKKENKICKEMIGYVLTHGLMKPNQSFIDSSKDD